MTEQLLKGRVAIVTGAGRGMGRTHALALAEAGASVVVNDIGASLSGDGVDSTPAEQVVAEIRSAGGRAVPNADNVADWEGASRLVAAAVDELGGLDILVNNAGILRDRMLVNLAPEDWDSVIAVHLRGTFCPTRLAANYWREQVKAGVQVDASVVCTTSPTGLHGNVGQTNYAAAKGGIAAFVLSAAAELERYGVRVNAISPGARTRMTDGLPVVADLFAAPTNPADFDRWAPENVSPLVVYLASPGCRVTGQVFAIQGSEVAQYRGWTVDETFTTDGRWTPAELDRYLGARDPSGTGRGLPLGEVVS
jgi:NAD(P)-dependent dehydrogenase (short-subunit alcohol dehydrogenase family)